MLLKNVNEADENYLLLGNTEDVCVFCAKERAVMDGTNLSSASKLLRGDLSGKYTIKLPINNLRVVICKEHVNTLYKNINNADRNQRLDKLKENSGGES